MEASDSDSNKTVLSQEKVDSSDNIENTSVDNNSVETSKATDLEKESNMSGACAITNKTVETLV
jgi:hypothetical protein